MEKHLIFITDYLVDKFLLTLSLLLFSIPSGLTLDSKHDNCWRVELISQISTLDSGLTGNVAEEFELEFLGKISGILITPLRYNNTIPTIIPAITETKTTDNSIISSTENFVDSCVSSEIDLY